MVAKFVHGTHEARNVHAGDAVNLDATLCGLSLDAHSPLGTLLPTDSRITCTRCKAIIRYCWSIYAAEIEKG